MTREEAVSSLREMANLLETTTIPVPNVPIFFAFANSAKELISIVKQLGKAKKYAYGNWYGVIKKVGFAEYNVSVSRGAVCERIVVGKRVVPAMAFDEHEEEIIEWKCPESLLEFAQTGGK